MSSALFGIISISWKTNVSANVGSVVRNETIALFMDINQGVVSQEDVATISEQIYKRTSVSDAMEIHSHRNDSACYPVCARMISWLPYDGVHTNTNTVDTSEPQTKSTRVELTQTR